MVRPLGACRETHVEARRMDLVVISPVFGRAFEDESFAQMNALVGLLDRRALSPCGVLSRAQAGSDGRRVHR